MWRNLLPQGTRTVELASGCALILSGILIALGTMPDISTKLLDNTGVLLAIFGYLQVLSIFKYPRLELLRTALSWAAGCFWIWLAVFSSSFHLTIEDIACLFLGLGNLYGFIINFNLLHIAWTD